METHTSSSSFSRACLSSSFPSHSSLSIVSPSSSIFAHCSEMVYGKIQVSPGPKSRAYTLLTAVPSSHWILCSSMTAAFRALDSSSASILASCEVMIAALLSPSVFAASSRHPHGAGR